MAKSFISELSFGDFQKLAAATRRAAYPRQLTDEQVVAFIENHGPVVAEQIVKAKLNIRQINGGRIGPESEVLVIGDATHEG